MKNLSAMPRLSLFAGSTILITFVVYLAGFTKAEVRPCLKTNIRDQEVSEEHLKRQSLVKENLSNSQQKINVRDDELSQQTNLNNLVKALEAEGGGVEKLMKRNSEDFDRESEDDYLEGDGYGYDDDEYYHLNFKRNDDTNSGTDNKEAVQEDLNKKGALSSQKFGFPRNGQNPADNKETQTVEMLSFKETHPNPGNTNENMAKNTLSRPLLPNAPQKKLPSHSLNSINISDLKGNSAIEEKAKEGKDEAGGMGSAVGASEGKSAEAKKVSKVGEEKETLKLKESKYGDDSEKKEKESSMKESKDNVAGKAIKESIKSIDEKKLDGDMKPAKLEDNIEKISSKSKDGYTSKITKEDRETIKISDKSNSAVVNPNEAHNHVSFASSDYKENMEESLKTQDLEEDDRESDEYGGQNIALNEDEINQKKDNTRVEGSSNNYEFKNGDEYSYAYPEQNGAKKADYMNIPVTFEVKNENLNDLLKKQESWKEYAAPQEDQPGQPMNPTVDLPNKDNSGPLRLNLPQTEFENTDYHKNYLKSLKHYKDLDSNSKILGVEDLNLANSKPLNSNEFGNSPSKAPSSGGLNPTSSKSSGLNAANAENKVPADIGLNSEKTKNSRKRKRSKITQKKSANSNNAGAMPQNIDMSNELKNIYAQINAMQQQQQQQQQLPMPPPLPHPAFSYNPSIVDGLRYVENPNFSAMRNNFREVRKSPTKLEYEIKIINQNQQGSRETPLLQLNQRRRKKEARIASNDQFGDKFIKKYPYSQVSREDLTRFKDSQNEFTSRKFKRKAPSWLDRDQLEISRIMDESSVKNRGAPSGYYSNRVKFGQKHYISKDDRQTVDADAANRFAQFSNKKIPGEVDSNFFQRSWREPQELQHDPIKRFDDNAIFGKNHQNSLLLVKKDRNGDRVAKTFVDANKSEVEGDLNSDQLAKMLSKDNDYIVLKKTDKNKFQKVDNSEGQTQASVDSLPAAKKYDIFGLNKLENIKDSNKHNRGVFIRSYRSSEPKLHNSGAKSNLKKTFEKFKDFADFFKDSEPESSSTQQSSQQVKDGSEIVFSEDKIPAPIVITNEFDGKTGNMKSKSPNSLPTISNNFKQIDQQDKKVDTIKFDEPNKDMFIPDKSNWEPALKNVFPEAKSINSMQKNGNEIIVLDFDRNHLKTDQGNRVILSKPLKEQMLSEIGSDQIYLPFGSVQKTPNPLTIQGNRQVEVVLNDGQLPTFLEPETTRNSEKKISDSDKAGSTTNANTGGYQQVFTLPLSQFVQLPYLIKQATDKSRSNGGAASSGTETGYKTVAKKSLNAPNQNDQISDNFSQFLRDYRELSEINKEQVTKKQKLSKKRNANQYSGLPPTSFPEMSSNSDTSVKSLGSLLQSIMNDESAEMAKDSSSTFGNSQKWQPGIDQQDKNSLQAPLGQWSSDNRRELPINRDEAKQSFRKYLYSDNEGVQDGQIESSYQNQLWEELTATSNKIQRLRRQGVAENKLREIMEKALPFRDKRFLGTPNQKLSPFGMSDSTEAVSHEDGPGDSHEKLLAVDGNKSETSRESSPRESYLVTPGQETKRSLKFEKSPKTTANGLADFVVNFNSDRDQTEELISSRNEIIGKENRRIWRRKRSPAGDFKTNVSNSEVEPKILKNLEEDIDQSVYSPGINRKLLSIDDETREGPDRFNNADENDGKDSETQSNCVKNSDNKCIDPFILNLFHGSGVGSSQNRPKRSLSGTSHSNYKREIDLDESMPNDFQNFLVTSLGLDSHVAAFGSHKRESKDTRQDEFGSHAENDMNLEKREVSNGQNYKENSDYYESGGELSKLRTENVSPLNPSDAKPKLQDKSMEGGKSEEYDEPKIPTQIRIQITKASAKEKKSSKPAFQDTEISANEPVDISTKDKEYYDKNKFTAPNIANPQKLFQMPMPKYQFPIDAARGEAPDEMRKSRYYGEKRPFRHARRKKKKYAQENPMKPVKDFIAFDQKAMESLIRKYFSDQNLPRDASQKLPTSNHLPQVETVYNPTQGTNKAQVEAYKPILKVNSLSNKNAANAKNSFDEGLIRSYLKDKPIHGKNDKQAAKEFEDVDWKPYSGAIRPRQNSPSNTPVDMNYKPFPQTNQNNGKPDMNLIKKPNINQARWNQMPKNNYISDASSANLFNPSDVPMKLQPPASNLMWNQQNKDNSNANNWWKYPNYLPGAPFNAGSNAKNIQPEGNSQQDDAWNMFDRYMNKKAITDQYKLRDSFGGGFKEELGDKIRYRPYKYLQPYEEDKSAMLEPFQPHVVDNNKEVDYSDTLDDEYLDADELKQEPQYEPVGLDINKKDGKIYDMSRYANPYASKNADLDDMLGDDDEELDEDYDENNEDGLDEYSLFASPNMLPEVTKNAIGNAEKFKGSYYVDDPMYAPPNAFPPKTNDLELRDSNLEPSEIRNRKVDERFNPADNQITLSEVKGEVDPFGSTAILKKVNENANILGKNLMKNLNRYSYDDTSKNGERMIENRVALRGYRNPENQARPKIQSNSKKYDWDPKLKRSHLMPIGNRVFYASKTESYSKDTPTDVHVDQSRDNNSPLYRLPKRNPLKAELRSSENDFEYESEHNAKHFSGNLLNNEQENENGESDNNNNESNGDDITDNLKTSNDKNYAGAREDVEDNIEDNSETISEDNVLENIIGKYIMRKSVKVKTGDDLNKNFDKSEKNEESDFGENRIERKRRKKSLGDELYPEELENAKVYCKRLASGHLTENNFKKFHKKNLKPQRKARTLDTKMITDMITDMVAGTTFEGTLADLEKNEDLETSKNKNKLKGRKRSLNIFKKIGGKEKENKKAEVVDVRAVGFEPILSSKDSQFQFSTGDKSESYVHNKESAGIEQEKSALKILNQNSGISEKPKSKLANQLEQTSKVEGPWKVELNEKDDRKSNAHKASKPNEASSSTNSKLTDSTGDNGNVKAYLVIRKSVRAVEETLKPSEAAAAAPTGAAAIESFSPTSGASKREVGNSYLPKSVTFGEKNWWRMAEDDHRLNHTPENSLNKPEKNRALQDGERFSKGDQKTQALHIIQRNTKRNINLVNAREAHLNSGGRQKPLTNGRPKRKSVFPPSTQAELTGDDRQVDEETSKFLGQQIVGSILSQVRQNPRFKEMIKPGLSEKPSAHEDKTEDKKRALNHNDYADQVQSILQRVMFDIEKIAEQNVRKRMCNKIDRESKEFLHSLLEIPMEKCEKAEAFDINIKTRTDAPAHGFSSPSPCCSDTQISDTERFTPSFDKSDLSSKMCQTLRKKQNALMKLIGDYQRLSELEKKTISVSFHYLKNELEETNRLLSSLSVDECPPEESPSAKTPDSHDENVNHSSDEHGNSFDTDDTSKQNGNSGFKKSKKYEGDNTYDNISDNINSPNSAKVAPPEEQGVEEVKKCPIKEFDSEYREACKATTAPSPPSVVYQFEPGDEGRSQEDMDMSTTTLGTTSEEPKEQGFEKVTPKSELAKPLDLIRTFDSSVAAGEGSVTTSSLARKPTHLQTEPNPLKSPEAEERKNHATMDGKLDQGKQLDLENSLSGDEQEANPKMSNREALTQNAMGFDGSAVTKLQAKIDETTFPVSDHSSVLRLTNPVRSVLDSRGSVGKFSSKSQKSRHSFASFASGKANVSTVSD